MYLKVLIGSDDIKSKITPPGNNLRFEFVRNYCRVAHTTKMSALGRSQDLSVDTSLAVCTFPCCQPAIVAYYVMEMLVHVHVLVNAR